MLYKTLLVITVLSIFYWCLHSLWIFTGTIWILCPLRLHCVQRLTVTCPSPCVPLSTVRFLNLSLQLVATSNRYPLSLSRWVKSLLTPSKHLLDIRVDLLEHRDSKNTADAKDIRQPPEFWGPTHAIVHICASFLIGKPFYQSNPQNIVETWPNSMLREPWVSARPWDIV